jgi:hypothetical protein
MPKGELMMRQMTKTPNEHGQHEIIHVHRLVEVDDAEEISTRHTLQSVFAMGEGGLQAEEEEHLRQCQRNHRRIDALTANGEITDDEAKGGCGENAEYEAEFRRNAPDFHRMGRDIGRAAEEGCMAEGQNAGIAQQKVEGRGEQRKAQHLHQEDGVDHEGRCQ